MSTTLTQSLLTDHAVRLAVDALIDAKNPDYIQPMTWQQVSKALAHVNSSEATSPQKNEEAAKTITAALIVAEHDLYVVADDDLPAAKGILKRVQQALNACGLILHDDEHAGSQYRNWEAPEAVRRLYRLSGGEGHSMLSAVVTANWSAPEHYAGAVPTDSLPQPGAVAVVEVLTFKGTGRDAMKGNPSGKFVKLYNDGQHIHEVK